MTLKEAQSIVRPWAQKYEDIVCPITEMDDDALLSLMEACRQMGTGNCGWSSYQVAQILLNEGSGEQNRRSRLAQKSV